MFGRKKTTTLNATAVFPLTDGNVELLRAMQVNHEIPEDAKYIAFLEDGDACFINEDLFKANPGQLWIPPIPTLKMVTYYQNIPIQFQE